MNTTWQTVWHSDSRETETLNQALERGLDLAVIFTDQEGHTHRHPIDLINLELNGQFSVRSEFVFLPAALLDPHFDTRLAHTIGEAALNRNNPLTLKIQSQMTYFTLFDNGKYYRFNDLITPSWLGWQSLKILAQTPSFHAP